MRTFLVFNLLFFMTVIHAQGRCAPDSDRCLMGIFPHTGFKQIQSTYLPIAEDISLFTDLSIKLIGSPTMDNYQQKIEREFYDFALVGPLQYVNFVYDSGYRPISRRDSTFQFVIAALPNSSLESLSDLKDRSLGLITKSLEEHIMANAVVEKHHAALKGNVRVIQFKNINDCFYALHINKVDACGAATTILRVLENQNKIKYNILVSSDHMPNATYVIHKDVHPETAELIKEYLLDRANQISANNKDYDVLRKLIKGD